MKAIFFNRARDVLFVVMKVYTGYEDLLPHLHTLVLVTAFGTEAFM